MDTDIALGTPTGDVDDAFAVAAVAASHLRGDVQLLGVSAVTGNTDGASSEGAARRLLAEMRVDAPVLAEAEAPRAIAALPAGATILAIGPPTNVVRAADVDPTLPSRVSVRSVGTVVDRVKNPLLPLYCLNFRTDPTASRRFFRLPWHRSLLFPLDVVRKLEADADALAELGSVGRIGSYLEAGSKRWLRQSLIRYGKRRFPVWDLVAALDAIDALPCARFVGDKLRGFAPRAAWRRFVTLVTGL